MTPHILVAGRGRVADALLEGLRRGGHAALGMSEPQPSRRLLRRARLLLLAGEASALPPQVDRLHALCRGRPLRSPPLRVVAVVAQGAAPMLPALPRGGPMTLEVLDLMQGFARSLFARWPIHGGLDPGFGQVPHLLFAGSSPLVRALAVQALRLAHYGERQAVLTFASADPENFRRSLLADYPQAGRSCRLRFTGLREPDLDGEPSVTSVYVCLTSAQEGLETARRLCATIGRGQGASPLVHLEVGDARPRGEPADWDGQLYPFSWLQEACRPEVWLDGRDDELARVVHAHYRDSIAAQGRDPSVAPAGRPWSELPSSYRDANRFQADHLWAKLAITDCRAVPEEQVESFAFAPLEVERLALVEHARWAADRYLGGWTYAPRRDDARRHHPQLVPYAQLSEPMKDLDRFAVRLVPVLLARSGRGVLRMLIVGVPGSGPGRVRRRALAAPARSALERLARRYPDRSLVLASTLGDSTCRLVVREALERFQAGLFLLCTQPIAEVIAAQPDGHARRDFLDLAARAERRVCLAGKQTPEDWFARRAELLILCDPARVPARPAKRVLLQAEAAAPRWNFEY
jgi:hypothetical protein